MKKTLLIFLNTFYDKENEELIDNKKEINPTNPNPNSSYPKYPNPQNENPVKNSEDNDFINDDIKRRKLNKLT